MAHMEGKYTNEKNENLDEYFKGLGVPYIPRKLICSSRPTMEISKNNDEWTISTSTMFRTSSSKFKFGEEYEETMPGGTIKNVTQMEGDNKLITNSVGPGEVRSSRKYEFIGDECVITYTSDQSPQVAKRYFKRC
ncbi:fatty acid-binding protein [Leptinotarsa decemlineata]|uniref:fatty acid-binding protein n=1 Tax=Leptinotarsa decemlineata TaxID=7539 RepID=UPI000C255B58|nr:fatty acid-binding protein-like [Leptinotarsa decemlineata]XP_023030131.1 fatty acid-binding protein-like [Leptinotarsa decemlineata]